MHHVQRFAVRDAVLGVDADDLRRDVQRDRLREDGRADMAEAEDGKFLGTFHEKRPLF